MKVRNKIANDNVHFVVSKCLIADFICMCVGLYNKTCNELPANCLKEEKKV